MFELPGYSILGELGSGGSAVVHLAEQTMLGRRVALKVLRPELCADPSFVERFLREGRLAAALRHQHIVTIFDVGIHEGRPFLAFDYFAAGSVAQRLPLAPVEALRCVREIASALDYAHSRGVIHRDVKPENILCAEDGSYALSDFGIARALSSGRLTQEGTTPGTPAYMSPEQWRDDALDARSDLYSLGVVLFQALCGRVPYDGQDAWAIGMKHLQAPLPELPPELGMLQGLLARMLAKHPRDRVASGSDVVRHIESIEREFVLPSSAITTSATPVIAGAPRTSRLLREWPHSAMAPYFTPTTSPPVQPGSRRAWIAGSLAAALSVALIAAWSWQARREPPSAASAESQPRLVVLPCEDFSDGGDMPLGDVLSAELTVRLSRLRGLQVIARHSANAVRTTGGSIADIAQRLDASHVVTCTLRPAGNALRIATELIDARTQTQQWSSVFERPRAVVLGGLDEISSGIAEQVLARLLGAERALLARQRSTSVDAVRWTEQATLLIESYEPDKVQQGLALLDRAVSADAGYLRPLTERVAAYAALNQVAGMTREDALARANETLAAAFAIDPDSAEALVLRAYAQINWEFEREQSLLDTRRAVALEPGSARVAMYAGQNLFMLGHAAEAIPLMESARSLDPLNPFTWNNVGAVYRLSGQFQRALEEFDRGLVRFPEDTILRIFRAETLIRLQRCDEAWREMQSQVQAPGDDDLMFEFLPIAAEAAACAGDKAAARGIHEQLLAAKHSGKFISPVNLGATALAIDDIGAALTALEDAEAKLDWRLLALLPPHEDLGFRRLWKEPRFLRIARRFGREPP